jgi:nitrite reductase/ring-hydroxylating ferredoxin subunit
LLIHLRDEDAKALQADIAASKALAATGGEVEKPVVEGMFGNFVAYSKICTHAGCPASLFEQQTNRLLCPCHQSQFLITEQARPIFGPAHRKLPMLPLELEDGFLVARSDYLEPVGPPTGSARMRSTRRRSHEPGEEEAVRPGPAAGRDRRATRRTVPGGHPAAPAVQQGLPRPLVVPAR